MGKDCYNQLNILKNMNFHFAVLVCCLNRSLPVRPWTLQRQKREEVGERNSASRSYGRWTKRGRK